MRIPFTGGAGSIRSAAARLAVAQRHDVVDLDAISHAANPTYLAPVAGSPLRTFGRAVIRDRVALDRVPARHRPNAVMHLAVDSHVGGSIDGPAAFVETDAPGSFHLLESARAQGLGLPALGASSFI